MRRWHPCLSTRPNSSLAPHHRGQTPHHHRLCSSSLPSPATWSSALLMELPLVSAPATWVLSFSGKWAVPAHSSGLCESWVFHLACAQAPPLPQTQSSTFTLCTRPPKTQFKCHFLRETFPNSTRPPITHFQPTGLVFSWYFAVCLDLRDHFIHTCLVHKTVNSVKIKAKCSHCTHHFSGNDTVPGIL